MVKRKTYDVTLTLSVPHGMRPERAKLEIATRINELSGWGSYYRAGRAEVELPDTAAQGGIRAKCIKVRSAARG